ncbi:Outer membrane receptor proteins, mostly Fe transport [Chitinophaga sp. YR573]|uniref:TonB-dependent receptor n=1 Tax=Chitinophaga sp. YR573 TaxID=1881040 RepID=UPI0008B09282|nr:TonB-dependent receptor [Chitinophaga sp. YR573]SEW25870.1 Outer membrane receptor proteins, mostly Fe transport [Chitinophaga sp. YR573]
MRQVNLLILTFFLTCIVFLTGFAQKGTRISGKVQDSLTLQPVEYASVKVTDASSGKIITGAVTAPDGTFQISDLAVGSYNLSIDFLGYTTFSIKNITPGKPVLVKLVSSGRSLQAFTVTSQAPLVENKIDKIVYNAANDVTSQGGTAIDLLRKVPQVNVDIDGNVELQGNSNIRFLINGKPSSIFGNSLADALASIPATQIKSIEAITSPGAKYDAQGTGGIINIILKDNKAKGINGNLSLSAGTRLENAAANINVRQGNFGMNAFFSGNMQLSSRTPYSQDRQSFDTVNKVTNHLLQNGYSDFKRKGYQSGIGFDWDLTSKDNLSGSFGYSYFGSQNIGNINQQQDEVSLGTRISNNHSSIHSLDWSLAYKRKELTILYSGSSGTPRNEYLQSQTYNNAVFPYTGSSSNNPGTDIEHDLSIDYSHKVNKNLTFETGVKTTLQKIGSNTDVQVFDTLQKLYIHSPLQSYQFNYDMKVYAGYLSASFSLFNFLDVKAGARFEHTDIKIDLPGTHIPSYNTVVPAIIFSHNLSNDRFVKLAYTRRIERPEYRELNPFLNLSDPYNITTGNPLLKPEIGNNIELGFGKTFSNGGNIYVALIERINTNDLKPYTIFYPSYQAGDTVYTNVSVTNRQNIGEEYNSAVNISGSLPLKDLTLRGNIMITQKRVVNNLLNGTQANGMNYRFNLNASYRLPKDLIVEAFGNYNSALNTIQGKLPQSLTYNLALRKPFWNKKASVGLTATNPFNKYVNKLTTVYAANYISTSLTRIPYRSFGISFTYKFGHLEFKKTKEQNNYLDNPPSMEN